VRVIVVGAGEVGSNIAASLADEHDVVVVDTDSERVEAMTYEADVLSIQGDGTDLDVLEEAGVDAADLLIASTDNDETNAVICGTARTVADPFTIARVRKLGLLETWQRSHSAFDVDFMVSSVLLTAQAIVRIIGLPAARDVDSFAGGTVQMAEFTVPDHSPIAGQTVAEADRYEKLTFAAILRNGEVIVPRGDTGIESEDRLVVIGPPSSVRSFAASLAEQDTERPDVVIIGGGGIGFQTARLLEERGFSPTLIEQDARRARHLAEELPATRVLENDATDAEFLTTENVDEADLVVAALDSDEKNLLVSLLTEQLGADRTVTVVENGEYVDLFETVGVDVAVNPRLLTAQEITRFTRENRMENVALIESDLAEVLELEVTPDSQLVGQSIQDIVGDIEAEVVIGAITRNGDYITPRGKTVVQAGDHVVVFAERSAVNAVMNHT
jgi:trk system potassium uptake protein TrkA